MADMPNSLIGLNLNGFVVQEVTEVYRINEDGQKSDTIAFFQDGEIAVAWAQGQTDPNYHETSKTLIITDGTRHFLFKGEEVSLYNYEAARLEVREKALSKLSAEEQTVLDL